MNMEPWELGLCRLRAPELSTVNAKVHEMLEEDRRQPIQREDKPGDDDPELRKAMAKRLSRKGEKADWLPLKAGNAYRLRRGSSTVLWDENTLEGTQALRSRIGGDNVENFDLSTGKYKENDAQWDVIGPYAPELEGKTPPEGYQWTGEFRVPKDDEIVSHMSIGKSPGKPTDGNPMTNGAQKHIRSEAQIHTGGKCWILIKL